MSTLSRCSFCARTISLSESKSPSFFLLFFPLVLYSYVCRLLMDRLATSYLAIPILSGIPAIMDRTWTTTLPNGNNNNCCCCWIEVPLTSFHIFFIVWLSLVDGLPITGNADLLLQGSISRNRRRLFHLFCDSTDIIYK